MSSYDIYALQTLVKEKLPEKRYRHTLGVAYTAANLAMRYDSDPDEAFLAGLFHDIAKCYRDEELLEKCSKYNLEVSPAEQNAPYLLHGKVGAYQTKYKYNITDESVCNAIACHTTGKPNMNLLEKIIFVADFMEPGRKMLPCLPQIRKMTYIDLDVTVALIMKHTLSYLEETKKPVDSTTRTAYEYYKHYLETEKN